MNLPFKRIFVRYKSSSGVYGFVPEKKKNFETHIFRKRNANSENNDLTSNQSDNNITNKSKLEFKVIRKNNSSPYDVPEKFQSIRRPKLEKKTVNRIFPNMSAKQYILRKNTEEKSDLAYRIIKRSFSTFSNNYHTDTLCANFMLKESENLEIPVKKKNSKIKYIKRNNLINLPLGGGKLRNTKNVNYRIIKLNDSESNLQEENINKAAQTMEEVPNIEELTIEQNFDKDNNENNNNLKDDIRENEINLQMLPSSLFRTIFPEGNNSLISPEKLNSIKEEFRTFGLDVDNPIRFPNVDLKLPSLEGKNIEEHFHNIASSQIKPYLKIINELIKNIPPVPEKWILQEGWTR